MGRVCDPFVGARHLERSRQGAVFFLERLAGKERAADQLQGDISQLVDADDDVELITEVTAQPCRISGS